MCKLNKQAKQTLTTNISKAVQKSKALLVVTMDKKGLIDTFLNGASEDIASAIGTAMMAEDDFAQLMIHTVGVMKDFIAQQN